MSGHTPGPWRHQLADDDDWDGYEHEVMGPRANGCSLCIGSVQRLEDARLIAAAPELLEALKSLLTEVPAALRKRFADSDTLAAFKQAEAAIAKATGAEA